MRKETVNEFSTNELLQMVKESLDELDIPYEEAPGGFGPGKLLDPAVFDLVDYSGVYTIKTYAPRSRAYRVRQSDRFSYSPFTFNVLDNTDSNLLAA